MRHEGEAGRSPLTTQYSLQTAMPVVIFLVVNRLAGLRWAVVAATVWSVKVLVDRRRRKLPLGRFMPIVTAAVLFRGAVGAITGSDAVYFGMGIATKYAAALVMAGSVVIRRPLAAFGAPYLIAMPPGLSQNPVFRSTMAIVTSVGAVYYAASASFDVWLYRRSSVEGFVVVRFLANWPLGVVAVLTIVVTTHRRLQRIPGLAPLSTLMEQRLDSWRPPPVREHPPRTDPEPS